MSTEELVLSYISITNLSVTRIVSLEMDHGAQSMASKASGDSGNGALTDQAVFFPWPAKDDTVSHPVKALHTGRTWVLLGPKVAAIL